MLRTIEYRFPFHRYLQHALQNNTIHPYFLSIKPRGRSIILDLYYDTPYERISNSGISARLRSINGTPYTWETKRNTLGDTSSFPRQQKAISFTTVSGLNATLALVNRTIPYRDGCMPFEAKFHLADTYCGDDLLYHLPLRVRFTTWRTEYLVDGRYVVRMDETDFGYKEGKLMMVVGKGEEEGGEDGWGRKMDAIAEVEAYAKKHAWFFGTGKDGDFKDGDFKEGKVSAFLRLPSASRPLVESPEEVEMKQNVGRINSGLA